jgi:uncharacterized membrane protein SpoIIM required for sporulation
MNIFSGLKNIFNFYVERYKKRFIYCFATYFILVAIGAIIGILNPDYALEIKKIIGTQFVSSSPGLFQAISTGKMLTVTATIFLINSIFASFLTITVPNVMGFGTITYIFRAIIWGLIYAPIDSQSTMLLLAVIPTLLLEGIAYVIAFTSSLDLPLALITPERLKEKSRWKAFKKAWIYNLKSYVLVLIVLLIAAIVETVTIALLI